MMIKSRSQFSSQYEWLWYLYNNLGCSNIEIAGGGLNSKGEIYFTKRYRFEDLLNESRFSTISTDNNNRIKKNVIDFITSATHRSILDIELCIDVDEAGDCKTIKEKTIQIIKKLRSMACEFQVYFTGSKSYHIHVFEPEFRYIKMNDRLKSLFLKMIGGDSLKVGRNMIALEGAMHYKSGKPKTEVTLT